MQLAGFLQCGKGNLHISSIQQLTYTEYDSTLLSMTLYIVYAPDSSSIEWDPPAQLCSTLLSKVVHTRNGCNEVKLVQALCYNPISDQLTCI